MWSIASCATSPIQAVIAASIATPAAVVITLFSVALQ
jgi:hypothetical protein